MLCLLQEWVLPTVCLVPGSLRFCPRPLCSLWPPVALEVWAGSEVHEGCEVPQEQAGVSEKVPSDGRPGLAAELRGNEPTVQTQ